MYRCSKAISESVWSWLRSLREIRRGHQGYPTINDDALRMHARSLDGIQIQGTRVVIHLGELVAWPFFRAETLSKPKKQLFRQGRIGWVPLNIQEKFHL